MDPLPRGHKRRLGPPTGLESPHQEGTVGHRRSCREAIRAVKEAGPHLLEMQRLESPNGAHRKNSDACSTLPNTEPAMTLAVRCAVTEISTWPSRLHTRTR